jgi:hypothetical protein
MITNGLIKALQRQRFDTFIRMIGIVNIKKHLITNKRIEAIKDQLIA